MWRDALWMMSVFFHLTNITCIYVLALFFWGWICLRNTNKKKIYHCVHSQSNSGKNARIPQHQGDSEVVGPIVQVLHAVDLHANQWRPETMDQIVLHRNHQFFFFFWRFSSTWAFQWCLKTELQEICWSAVLGICHLCTVEGRNIFRPEASRVPRDDSKFRIPPKYAVCAAYLEQKDCNVVCC